MTLRLAEPAVAPFSAEEAAVAEQFLKILASDAEVRRRYIECDHDFDAVAQLIAETTGKQTAVENLPSIAGHLTRNFAHEVAQVMHDYPAVNMVVDARNELGDIVMPYSAEEIAVADKFIDLLVSDADVRRRYLEADHDMVAVAKVISEATGTHVGPVNLISIRKHVILNRSKQCGELVNDHPAMNFIVESSE